MKNGAKLVGSVCLYGGPTCGYGYLAGPVACPAKYGDGEPQKWRSLNDAFWLGMIDLACGGYVGLVEIFAPGGQLMATASNKRPLPYYGELHWGPAKVWVISAEAILAAAAKGGAN